MAEVQRDWQHREFIESVTVNVLKIVEFLNKFDISTRYRLSKLNDQLSTLERRMDSAEAQLSTVFQQQQEGHNE
ncbi:uncharacterized protein AMSG_01377 [Thecamonas trahens ATCC 50062]|uniref:BRICK1 protein n=1 Tax=Thecamonas trahens ATCC 50062 TaxID=461836 RepID=A0A0L0DMY3_THETB|nr:hypothetical protein AMSG_01377 [Thecamonas trahens ATCC 50062]KNC53667.1 hypothetical protein AMSG_01377 [Thecamonas trahens ATCC 50062]|eukprot:XP_013761981.1 hypothetical protein AMSG_01377 [Thecamonas trahens ATCC 50062]